MTKRLTLKEVDARIQEIEDSYYKGHKLTEYEIRFTSNWSQADIMYWCRLKKIKNKLIEESN